MPTAETMQPARMTGRRPSVSATRPPGNSAAQFSAANRRNPIPVQIAERCRTSWTNSGTRAPRTPSAAKPSARLADAAARQGRLRAARHDRRQDRGHDEQAAVDEERSAQRPRRDQPAHRGTADPAEQEAAAEQAAGAAALAAGHGTEEQGLGADAEHRRTHPAAAAQDHELHEGPG